MSPNQVIPVENGPLSPIAESVMKCPSLTWEFNMGRLVIAAKAELIVRRTPFDTSPTFRTALTQVADRVGSLADTQGPPSAVVRPPAGPPAREAAEYEREADDDYPLDPEGPLGEVELWRLRGDLDSIEESQRLVKLVDNHPTPGGNDPAAVSPNHVAILSPVSPGGCPAAPPTPACSPCPPFIKPPTPEEPAAKVTILDSGYIWVQPPHRRLDQRVTVVRGQYLDPNTNTWQPDEPDGLYTNLAGQLDGISGHGTFIAGLVAHVAPRTRLEVVGLRNQEVEIPIGPLSPGEQLGLFETEFAIAHAMIRRCDTDVIQCGFAFPTLNDYPSLPFAAVMAELRLPRAPRNGRVAVVSPAGNEQSASRYWPAALPDVIGVASTNRRGDGRAWFSNWGNWCDCCTRGEYVYSTFVYWDGPVEGDPLTDSECFRGWARWDGTSFAAPKVSAEIARLLIEPTPEIPAGTLPADIGNMLIGGTAGVPVGEVIDGTLSGAPGVALPYMQIR
ncbi:MAG TPA: S8/S53 family peptidase [Solirubrobacteraceae bacterium]|nr:S8/S53 family peptidase [Solirubrobacteraceae bacterium]